MAGLENLAASRLRRGAFGHCRDTKPARRAARMAPTPDFAAAHASVHHHPHKNGVGAVDAIRGADEGSVAEFGEIH